MAGVMETAIFYLWCPTGGDGAGLFWTSARRRRKQAFDDGCPADVDDGAGLF
jgi:hypothetical protein